MLLAPRLSQLRRVRAGNEPIMLHVYALQKHLVGITIHPDSANEAYNSYIQHSYMRKMKIATSKLKQSMSWNAMDHYAY